jgi:hypothetical protein
MKKFSSWGYRINYDKAIAEDERQVAYHESALANGWFNWGEWVGFSATLSNLVLEKPEAAVALGLSTYDLGCLALVHSDLNEVLEGRYAHHISALPQEAHGVQWRRGREVEAQLKAVWPNETLYDEGKLREELKLHKTRLARHKRNKDKFGGGQ